MAVKLEKYNLQIQQGSDLRFAFRVKGVDGLPEDVTGRTFRGQIRAAYGSADVLATFNITPRDQVTNKGEVDVHLPNTALPQSTLNLTNKAIFVYDIEMVYSTGDISKVLKGNAEVFPEVTLV